MTRGKKIGICVIGILLIIIIISSATPIDPIVGKEQEEVQEEVREKLVDGELIFGNEWKDADTLRELRASGKITQDEECNVILLLIVDSWDDAYLVEFWGQFLREECR